MTTSARYLTLNEVAEMLRTDEETVRALLHEGRIPAFQWGSSWSIPAEPLERFLEEELSRQMAQRGGNVAGRARPSLTSEAVERGQAAKLPDTGSPKASVSRRTQDIQFIMRGRSFTAPNAISLLETVLKELARTDDSFFERLSKVRGRTRRYVSREPSLLYEGRPDLAEKYVRALGNGWWMGTNYSRTVIDKVLREACAVAGLKFGQDLIIKGGAGFNRLRALEIVGLAADSNSDVARRHDEYYADVIERGLRDERS